MEIFYKGEWGTVCDDGWNLNNAEVVCRQLGYKYTIRALQGSYVPDGSGKIWLDNVACDGTEQNLNSCSHAGWGAHDCFHNEDAGVECSSAGNALLLNHFILRQFRAIGYHLHSKTDSNKRVPSIR